MERQVEDWTIEELHKERGRIAFPEYQREPRLWPEEKRARLIDSILQNIDIPKLYFYKVSTNGSQSESVDVQPEEEEETYEVVDGQQRLWAIWGFIDGEYKYEGKKFDDLPDGQPDKIRQYELQITMFKDADDEYLRDTFLRLQLGLPLNIGEKLHALSGRMKDLVFDVLASHEFITHLGIPERRFARETLCAQICINSFVRQSTASFARTRYEDLESFFKKYEQPIGIDKTLFDERSKKISENLNGLWESFGKETKRLRNRSYILSVYLFFEDLEKAGEVDTEDQKNRFVKFILTLWDSLKAEASKGIDRTDRSLYKFEAFLSSAPGEKYQIERRHTRLKEYYEFFKKTGDVKGLPVPTED